MDPHSWTDCSRLPGQDGDAAEHGPWERRAVDRELLAGCEDLRRGASLARIILA